MKKIILLFIALSNLNAANAQNNVAGINPLSLGLKNLNLKYELVVNKNQSLALNGSYMLERTLPFYSIENANLFFDKETTTDIDIEEHVTGYSFFPEYRFYMGKKKDAPQGFYVAPYFRYNHYNFEFIGPYEGQRATFSGIYSSIGGGIQLGMQWIVNDFLSFDLQILGLGINSNNLNARFETDNNNEGYGQIKQDIELDVEDVPILGGKMEVTATDDYVEGKGSFIIPGVRGGLSIGIAF